MPADNEDLWGSPSPEMRAWRDQQAATGAPRKHTSDPVWNPDEEQMEALRRYAQDPEFASQCDREDRWVFAGLFAFAVLAVTLFAWALLG